MFSIFLLFWSYNEEIETEFINLQLILQQWNIKYLKKLFRE